MLQVMSSTQRNYISPAKFPDKYDRSAIAIDGKKTLITKDVNTHIILTVIKSLFEKFLGIRKTGEFVPHADGWCSDSDNEIDFRFPFAGASSTGEAELNNALYPNHVIKCIHTVHRHKRCYECCCYSCCRAMQCHSRTQIHWREWQRVRY